MSWSPGQQRTLDRIEEALLADDQSLGSLFAFFTTLAGEDAMPRTERTTPRRLPRQSLLAAIGLVAAMLFLLTLLSPGRPACPPLAVTTSALSSSAARPASGCLPGPSARRDPAGHRPAKSAAAGRQPTYPDLHLHAIG
jgi:hypothetical protein